MLKKIQAPIHNPIGKFCPNWGGPFIIKEILLGEVIRLMDLDSNEFREPTNLDQLKSIVCKAHYAKNM